MKGIIVVDMPECCKYCPFVTSRVNGNYYCSIKESIGVSLGLSNPISDDEFYSKPNWCPIKPIPKRKTGRSLPEYDTDIHYEIGWNSCIDAIIGER